MFGFLLFPVWGAEESEEESGQVGGWVRFLNREKVGGIQGGSGGWRTEAGRMYA